MDKKTKKRMVNVGRRAVRGIARGARAKWRTRVNSSSAGVKASAGHKIENLASQIRKLGNRVESHEEAQKLARQVEKTADYIRFRPASKVADDLLKVAKDKRVYLTAGSLLAGFALFRLLRRGQESA